MTLTLGSLCSGYEGLGMAIAQVLDVELAWVADPDKGAATVLAHHYPDVPNLGDITAVDWSIVTTVDVVAAGFPCQSVSVAGGRAGLVVDAASGLWSHVAVAIDTLRPSLVVIENVGGLRSARADSDVEPCPWCLGDPGDEPHLRALGAVLGDLAALGFHAEWTSLRASDVGAAHPRERVFVAAAAADASRDRRDKGRPESARLVGRLDAALGRDAAADPHRDGRKVLQRQEPRMGARDNAHGRIPGSGIEWGNYAPAIDRWARVLGRPAPRPTEPGRTGERLSPRFVEWLMGLPEGHVTAVPGLTRNQMLTMLGNGVVWQQGAAALVHLLDRIGWAAQGGSEAPAA